MYEAHFGLKKRLFEEGLATDSAVFHSAEHDRLIAQFKVACASATSVIVLRGPAGVGKSTLTSTALRATSTRLALAWLNGTPMNAAELLELLLVELGISATRTTRMERLQTWRQFQAEMAATGSRLFVVAERTEDLPTEVLHALDSLTSADAGGHPGANVVLLGHQGLDAHLAEPVLESFRQRIRLRAELKPFSEAELQDYLRHQVACAGGHYDSLVAPGTVTALHRYSRGVARQANNLCETALALAASRSQSSLTPQLVTEAATAWLCLSEPVSRAADVVAQHALATSVAAKPAPIVEAADLVVAPPVMTVAAQPPVMTFAVPAVTVPAVELTSAVAFAPAIPTAAPSLSPPAAGPSVVEPTAATAPSTVAPPTAAAATTTVPTASAGVAPAEPSSRAPSAAPVATPPPPVMRARSEPVAPAPVPVAPKVAPQSATEFDGGATDVPDVSIMDFPVLTDAVEAPLPVAPKRPATPPPAAAATPVAPPTTAAPAAARTIANPSAAPRAATPPAPPAPATHPRLETAYAAARSAPPPKKPVPAATTPATEPAPAPKPPVAATPAAPSKPTPAPLSEPVASDDDDLLRQTQTMRAISAAKSIDDISSSMAETLFGDAELDFLSAALASAAGWPEAEPSAAAPPAPAKPAAAKPAPPKAASPASDDLLDLLGLGADAPLELIDDSTQPPADRPKSALRR